MEEKLTWPSNTSLTKNMKASIKEYYEAHKKRKSLFRNYVCTITFKERLKVIFIENYV